MNEIPVPPSQLTGAPHLPPALEQLILRCLAKNPEDRYESAATLREDLARTTATVERAIRRPPRGASRAGLWSGDTRQKIALAAIVVLFLALAGFVFWKASGLTVEELELGNEVPMPSRSTLPASGRDARPPKVVTATDLAAGSETRSERATALIHLYSTPQGAKVFRRGDPTSLGTTPLHIELPHPGQEIDLTFELPGHRSAHEKIRVVDKAVVAVALDPLDALSRDANPTAKRARTSPRTKKRPPRRRSPSQASRRRATGEQTPAKKESAAQQAPPGPQDQLDPFAQ